MPSCVIIVQNLPVPLDRRVWQQATSLRQVGWTVSVICPATLKYPKRREILDGIRIFRHSLPIEARKPWGFLLEYAVALFHEFRLLFAVYWAVGFDVIQVCNPPDIILLAALPWKLLGKRLVYDQHDLCSELVEVKFGDRPLLKAATALAEKLSIKIADHVICANDTFRDLAIARGRKQPQEVTSVYSMPDQQFYSRIKEIAGPKTSGKIVIGYSGIIGAQDGVDNIVLMAKHLVTDSKMKDFRCVVVGDGPVLIDIKRLARQLDLAEYFTFTGFLFGDEFLKTLSQFDIGVIPDPLNAYTDKISMNKVFEYAALGLPIVAFNLRETRRLLGDAAIFTARNDAIGLADEVARLVGNPELRHQLGQRAKTLAATNFDWSKEAAKYVAALSTLTAADDFLKPRIPYTESRDAGA